MRWRTHMMAALTLGTSGCSMLVSSLGTDATKLDEKATVRAKFGEPDDVHCTDDGLTEEVYFTRHPIADDHLGKSVGKAMMLGMTLGLIEFYWLPEELALLIKRTIFGQDVVIRYSDEGRVVKFSRDGHSYLLIQPHPKP